MRLFGWFSNTVHLKKMITYIQQKKNAGILKTQGFSKRRDSQNQGIKYPVICDFREYFSRESQIQGIKIRDLKCRNWHHQGIYFPGLIIQGYCTQGKKSRDFVCQSKIQLLQGLVECAWSVPEKVRTILMLYNSYSWAGELGAPNSKDPKEKSSGN